MSDYNPYNNPRSYRTTDLFSSDSLDALKDAFVAESSFAQMYLSYKNKDNYSLIKNQLLEFRGMDDQGDREAYDPYQDPIIKAQPIENLSILGNVQTIEERDLVLRMLADQQEALQYRLGSGLIPNMIGSMGGGAAGFTGLSGPLTIGKGLIKSTTAGLAAISVDEAINLSTQPTRTLDESALNIATVGGFTATFSLAEKTFRALKGTYKSTESQTFANDFATQTQLITGELGEASRRPFTRKAVDEDFFEETAKPRSFEEETAKPKSAGSAATPDQFRIMPEDEPYITLGNVGKEFNANFNKNYGEKLSSAWGLEKIPDNPVKRILMGESNYLRQMVGHLVEHPYFQLKNFNGTASSVGIDRVVNSRWLGQSLVPAMRETEAIYKTYRERTGLEAEKGFLRQKGMDMIKGRGEFLSPDEFLEEVSKAKRRIGSAEEADMIPEVLQAASLWDKKIFKPLAEEAKSLQMFSILPRRELARTRREVSIKTSALAKATPDKKIKIKEEIDLLNVKVQDLQKQIIDADNLDIRETFVNRLYRRDYMDTPDGKKAWYEVLAKHGYSKQEAEGFRIGILGEVPYSKIETDPVGLARSLRERTLADIPDTALEPFLESNMFALGRYYAMRMGTDVELVRKFGSVDLLPHFENVKAEFNLRRFEIAEGKDKSITIANLNKAEKQAIEDLTVLRDRMRGTYGLPDNPDSWTNRGMRMARGFNAMTMLTGALAAVPDVARIAMHSGMKNMFGTMFEALADNMKLAKLGKYETNLTGEALDDYLSLRAALFADLADSISVRHPMEKAMGEATQMFFNVSLMNQWNVAVKTMAGLVAGSRMIDDIAVLAKGKGRDLERARTRLARSGIGLTDAKLINAELSKHMLKGRKYVKIARTQLWENTKVAELFRAALGKEVNTIIVTPGLGDLPNTIGGGLKNMFPQNVRNSAREFSDSIENPTLKKGADAIEGIFVSPELSRLIFQFKSFGIAATQRILIPGLQHTDKSVLTGAVMLIGLGVLVDQLRRNQNDINIPQSGGDILMRGIERSGILGYFSDVGRAIENFSHPISRPGRFFEQLGGPFVHQIRDASDVLYDYSGLGNINKTTNRHARDLMYLSNVAHFDWLMDGAERGLNYLTVGKN